jgi:hypothetical protein
MNQELIDHLNEVEWLADLDTKLQDIKEALMFVTDDQYSNIDNYFWRQHSDNLYRFFGDTNDSITTDWIWEDVLLYWTKEDIENALEVWEDAGCPDTELLREQAYEELESA